MVTSSSTTACVPNVSRVINVELNYKNCPIHKLMSFVDGSSPCPPQFLSSDDDGNKTKYIVNPEFEDWVQKG
ncbi:unnamed protein product [Malus baccata var. baccata]